MRIEWWFGYGSFFFKKPDSLQVKVEVISNLRFLKLQSSRKKRKLSPSLIYQSINQSIKQIFTLLPSSYSHHNIHHSISKAAQFRQPCRVISFFEHIQISDHSPDPSIFNIASRFPNHAYPYLAAPHIRIQALSQTRPWTVVPDILVSLSVVYALSSNTFFDPSKKPTYKLGEDARDLATIASNILHPFVLG